MLEKLSHFKNLEELNLSSNPFTTVPEDWSCLGPQLQTLNISNVELEDFEASVAAIATLIGLKSLYVNLFEEDQVDLIMNHLPELEFLNSLAVDRDVLENDSENN